MSRNTPSPSFLPFLAPDPLGFRLDVTTRLSSTNPNSVQQRYVFRVLSDKSPLTRLLRADVVTGSGPSVQPVFLLLQRDRCRLSTNELWPLTNLDIEASWREADAYFSGNPAGRQQGDGRPTAIRLVERTTDDDGPATFHPLFFCNHRNLFFHPTCPGCGGELDLCRDDDRLLSQGLRPYTTSLRRYLHCPSCPPDRDGNGFFVPAPEPGEAPGVGDTTGLIAGWRHLLAGGIAPVGFPCSSCAERPRCHGPETLSASRIVPFCFFPFHLLAFKAMTVGAADFIPLLSGADISQIESRLGAQPLTERRAAIGDLHRVLGEGNRFLFAGTGKHFLEILYLKLSFLNDLSEMLRVSGPPMDIRAALDSLWVTVPPQAGLLPALWNFTAEYLDIGLAGGPSAGLPQTHPAQTAYFLGVVWFHTLLSNPTQPTETVLTEVSTLFKERQLAPSDFDFGRRCKEGALFNPENIFWTPGDHPLVALPVEWKALWEKTLAAAWNLLTAEGPEMAFREVSRTLPAVITELKNSLFGDGKAPINTSAETEETAVSETLAIHRILSGILAKWKTDLETSPPSPSAGAYTETLVMSPDDIEKESGKPAGMPPAAESLPETIIVRPKRPAEEPAETIVIAAIPPAPTGKGGWPAPQDEDIPGETLIVSRNAPGKPVGVATSPPLETAPEDAHADEFLSETVILRPPRR